METVGSDKEPEEKCPEDTKKLTSEDSQSESDKMSVSITSQESVNESPCGPSSGIRTSDTDVSMTEGNPLVASTSISPSTSSSLGSSSLSERSRSKSPTPTTTTEHEQSFEKDLERKFLRKIHYYILDILRHIVEADRGISTNLNTSTVNNNNCTVIAAATVNAVTTTATNENINQATTSSSVNIATVSTAVATGSSASAAEITTAPVALLTDDKTLEKSSNEMN